MILMGMLVFSFGIWGIADIFRGYGRQTLIRVGDTEINSQDYMRAQQDVLRAMSSQAGRSLSLQEARAAGLDARVLERLIGGAAVDTHAKHLHLGISDAALLEEIMKDPAFKDAAGNFSPAAFQQGVRTIGMSEAGLFELAARAQFAPADSHHHRQGGEQLRRPGRCAQQLQRGDTHAPLRAGAAGAAGTIADPTDDELKRYYDNHHSKFTQPEFRKLGVLAVTPETRQRPGQITESDIKAAYEAEKDQLGKPERRHVQQIPFPDHGRGQRRLSEDSVRHRLRRDRQGARR